MAFSARILTLIGRMLTGLAVATAVPAGAQTAAPGVAEATAGQVSGLRYLHWSGKRQDPSRAAPPAVAAMRREAPVPPVAIVYGPPVPAERPRNGLTPASAWLPTGAPAAPAAPVALPVAGSVAAPAVVEAPDVATPSLIQPARVTDAPRPDAPIFRLAAAGPAAMPAAPVQPQAPIAGESPRFYSVHRAAGRTPDPVALPAPVMLDQAPVDLAEPEGPPVILRDARGRLVPAEVLDGSTLP